MSGKKSRLPIINGIDYASTFKIDMPKFAPFRNAAQ